MTKNAGQPALLLRSQALFLRVYVIEVVPIAGSKSAGTFLMVASFSPLLALAILLVALIIRRRLFKGNAQVFDLLLKGIPAGRRASGLQPASVICCPRPRRTAFP